MGTPRMTTVDFFGNVRPLRFGEKEKLQKRVKNLLTNAEEAFIQVHNNNLPCLQKVTLSGGGGLGTVYVSDILSMLGKEDESEKIYARQDGLVVGTFTEGGEQLLTDIIGLPSVFADVKLFESPIPYVYATRVYLPQIVSP